MHPDSENEPHKIDDDFFDHQQNCPSFPATIFQKEAWKSCVLEHLDQHLPLQQIQQLHNHHQQQHQPLDQQQ